MKNSVETPSLAGGNFKVPLEISSVELEMIDAFEFSAAAWRRRALRTAHFGFKESFKLAFQLEIGRIEVGRVAELLELIKISRTDSSAFALRRIM